MFYTWDDNIAIAQNKYPLSEIELRKSIKNLRLANDILAKHHKTFVFSIAPSKVGIYPEYLYVKTADEINASCDHRKSPCMGVFQDFQTAFSLLPGTLSAAWRLSTMEPMLCISVPSVSGRARRRAIR